MQRCRHPILSRRTHRKATVEAIFGACLPVSRSDQANLPIGELMNARGKHIHRISLFLSLILFFPSAVACADNSSSVTHVWFLLYEAGETHALAPLIKALDDDPDHYQVTTYAFGPAVTIASANSVDLSCPVEDCAEVQRQDSIPETVLKGFPWSDPITIISAFPAHIQKQIAAYAVRYHARLILYDTNFSLHVNSTFLKPIEKIAPDEIWVPICSKQASYKKAYPRTAVFAVGQPSLDDWTRPLTGTERDAVTRLVPEIASSGKKIMVAGSYGGFYERNVLRTLQAITGATGTTSITILASHPTKGWQFDSGLIRQHGLSVVHAPRSLPTSQLFRFCDIVLVFRSTVGLQAALAGKSVFFIEERPGEYEDFALRGGFADVLLISGIEARLRTVLGEDYAPGSNRLPMDDCLPKNAVERMIERLR